MRDITGHTIDVLSAADIRHNIDQVNQNRAWLQRLRGRHPKKEVEKALSRAREKRIKIEQNRDRGHKWGDVGCQDTDHAKKSVWSTPKNPGNHAKDIDRYTEGHEGHRR